MSYLQVLDKTFIPLLSESQILDRIQSIANEINQDYKNKQPLFLVILNGSFMFASDIFKKLSIQSEFLL